MFNSCNDPSVTNFIGSQTRRLFILPSSHSYDKTNPRDYIGTRTLLYLIRTWCLGGSQHPTINTRISSNTSVVAAFYSEVVLLIVNRYYFLNQVIKVLDPSSRPD